MTGINNSNIYNVCGENFKQFICIGKIGYANFQLRSNIHSYMHIYIYTDIHTVYTVHNIHTLVCVCVCSFVFMFQVKTKYHSQDTTIKRHSWNDNCKHT